MSQEQLSFQQKSLVQQGYKDFTPQQLKQLDWGLRFTPIVCSALTAYGLYTERPEILLTVSVLGIWAFFAPAAHPMDLIYNHVVRHLFQAVALPPNPFQRRLACFAAGVMNATAAALFITGAPEIAKVVGGVLLALQAIVITTHFCALSWIYDIGVKMMGNWEGPIELAQARELLQSGAEFIDVREPNEFARGHLEGAQNFPLSQLEKEMSQLKGKTCLIYCASGMRSQMATKQLKQRGFTEVYNVGGMSRAKEI
ncbi:MAG TPA: DUF4395 family protein [Phycisphaerales bacterium]|nr:DUF4395 family protein [Phycisphaerales bacterium]